MNSRGTAYEQKTEGESCTVVQGHGGAGRSEGRPDDC